MNRRGASLVPPLLVGLVGGVLVAIMVVEWIGASLFSLGIYLIASTVLITDAVDVAIRLLARRIYPSRPTGSIDGVVRQATSDTTRPFALVISVHNLMGNIADVLARLSPWKAHVWIVDDCSSDSTASLLRQAGWRCLESPVNLKKPGALKALLDRLPDAIVTVCVLDPDLRILDSNADGPSDFETVVRNLQTSGAAACCPQVTVRSDGFLANLQVVEYQLAFELGRRSLGSWVTTSGVALYDRKQLQDALDRHSLSVYAEDLENAILLLSAGGSIYYDRRLRIETDGQRTLGRWFSQRVGWSFGLLKVLVERMPHIRRVMRRSAIAAYQYGLYLNVLCVLIYPFKVIGLILLVVSAANGIDNFLGLDLIVDRALTSPLYFAAIYAKYTLLIIACCLITRPRLTRGRLALAIPAYFFYANLQLLPTGIGYLNWIGLRLAGKRVFNDHYDANPRLHLPSRLSHSGDRP